MLEPDHPCAWCLRERNEPLREEDSHGICERHKAEVLTRLKDQWFVLDKNCEPPIHIWLQPEHCECGEKP